MTKLKEGQGKYPRGPLRVPAILQANATVTRGGAARRPGRQRRNGQTKNCRADKNSPTW